MKSEKRAEVRVAIGGIMAQVPWEMVENVGPIPGLLGC